MSRSLSYFLFFACFSISYSLNTNDSNVMEYNEHRKENIRNCLEKVYKVFSKAEGAKLYKNCFKNKTNNVNTERTINSDSDLKLKPTNNTLNNNNNNTHSEKPENKEVQNNKNLNLANSNSKYNSSKTDLIVFNFGDFIKLSFSQDSSDFYLRIGREHNVTGIARKKSTSNTQLLSYALVPALMVAGIMPWVMPGLQIAATLVAAINQFAFTSSVVMLIRSYIFDSRPEEHVVYVNHGYKNKKKETHYHND